MNHSKLLLPVILASLCALTQRAAAHEDPPAAPQNKPQDVPATNPPPEEEPHEIPVPGADKEVPPPPLVISTDRPGFSESTSIVPAGHLQLESGYQFTYRDRSGVENLKNDVPEILLRYGLLEDRLELRFSDVGYLWSRTNIGDGNGYTSADGWTDVAFGLKLKIFDQDGWLPRLAFDATSTIGVGSTNASSQKPEPVLKLLWSYDLSLPFGEQWKGFLFGGNLDIAWPTTNGEHFTQGQYSVYLWAPICDKTSAFVEFYLLDPNGIGTSAAPYFDFGGAYLINNRIQLDARVGFGLNNEADNFLVGVGISFLF